MPAPLQKSIAVDILIKITEEFCDFCEKSASLNLERKIFLLSKLLSKLQAAIYDIDEVLPEKLPLDFEPGRPSTGLAKDFLDFGRFEGYTLTLEPYNL
ncbi:MAG TPA: hypothetical protein PK803_05015, partial [Alphaproteobacteria bacterium]|nr:hypothetical protein [Alphaproteobacteria bacterium]